MSELDNTPSTSLTGAGKELVPLPDLVPFMEQVSQIALVLRVTAEVGTFAVFPDLEASIREGACVIKDYRDKHAKALSELEKQTSEWSNSIDMREAEVGTLNQRKDQADVEIQNRAKVLATKRADLVRLQLDLENSEKLLQDAKSQLELAKADLTSTERQTKDRQAEMTNLQLEEDSLRATRAKEELRLQKRAIEIETHGKSVYTREEQVKFRETNVKAGEDAVLSREVQSNMARIQAEKDRDQLKVEIEVLSTQKGDLEEQAKHIRANLTRQLREQVERNSRLDQRADAIEQLTERSIAQKEDLERRQIEVEEATKVSEAMRYDLEGLRKKLQMQQISIYADQKALEQGQKSIEREHQTVVTYAKGLEETVLKKDPAYAPLDIEDDEIRTATISAALVTRFDDINGQLREQREANDTSLKEMESSLRLAEDQHRNLIELERKARKRNEEFKKDLKIVQTQCAELRQQVADYLQSQQSANDLVASLQRRYDQICEEVDARKASELEYRKALGEERTAHAGTKGAHSELDKRIAAADEGTRSAQEELSQLTVQRSSAQQELTQLRSQHSSAQEELNQLTAQHSSAQEELTQLRAQHSSAQEELTQLTAKHSSAQEELTQLTSKHFSAQLRVEELQNKVQELTAWKEKTTESLSSLTAVRVDKEHLQTENRRLQEERKTLTTDLEAKRKRIEALENLADNQQVLSDSASRRLAVRDRTIDDLQATITRLRRPRDSEHVAQRERRLMHTTGEFETFDNAQQRRPADSLPAPSEMGLDHGCLSRPASPYLPQAKRRRTGPKEVPRRSTNVDDGGKRLGLGVRDEDEEARRISEFPDADKSADCVIAKLSSIRNGTDDTALPAEVKERLLEQLKYWDGRTRDWASRLQPKNAEVKCCEHVVQRKACQWHSDEEGLLDCYRACPFCAKNRKVCVIVIGEDEILLLQLSDEDRKTYYPGRMSFEKEDVAYWLKSDKQIR